jgi:tryptophan halogenase
MIKIAVIGTGTVGIFALAHLLGHLPKDFQITSIYDPNIKILGVGESAQPNFLNSLYKGANFKLTEDAYYIDATIKLGGKFIDWRDQDFIMTLTPPNMSMHFNNFKLKEFCFQRFNQLWGERFKTIEGNVVEVKNIENKFVDVVVGKEKYLFDYVMDCRGYPEDFSNYKTVDSIPVNHALIYVRDEPGTWTTTVNQATEHGWMFGLPLQTRNAWGYLYNDAISSKDEVVKDICSIFKVNENEIKLNEFAFKNYKALKFFDGRIMLNGNRALFYEPLEALSNYIYELIIRHFFDHVVNHNKFPHEYLQKVEITNREISQMADDFELFINFLYHGGSTFDSKFWNITKQNASEFLGQSPRWKRIVNDVKHAVDNNISFPIAHCSIEHWKEWSKNLQYNYF